MMLGMARTISMAVEDLYDATAFIVDKADEWGIDSSQIVACGSSAGAITVLHGEYALCNASPLVRPCLLASATRVLFLSPGRSSKWARSSFGHRSPRR